MLEVADSSLTYRRRYLTQLEVPAVVDLLRGRRDQPAGGGVPGRRRSRSTCRACRASRTTRSAAPTSSWPSELRTMLRLADLSAACRPADGRRGRLNALADRRDRRCWRLDLGAGRARSTSATPTVTPAPVVAGAGAAVVRREIPRHPHDRVLLRRAGAALPQRDPPAAARHGPADLPPQRR